MATIVEEAPATVAPEPSRVPPSVRGYRPDVEGLRAVAVALVVLYHAGANWLPGGYVGVDVFFVISGFLITSLLLREFDADGRLSLGDFYARRARRILPLASLVLIATLGAASMALPSVRLGSIARDGLWTSVFAANFRFASSGADYLNATAPPSPLQHFWSLAVEEQFYIVWPALLWAALVLARPGRGRRGRAAAITGVVVAASLAYSIYSTPRDANTAYFSPFTRGWELGAGALVAILATSLVRLPRVLAAVLGWLGVGLIATSALVYGAGTQFPGKAALLPIAGAVLVIVAGLAYARGGPETVLGLAPMQRLGKYSFSLYLWHWPLLTIAEQRTTEPLSVGARAALVVVAVLLSALTYHVFENPIRRWPRLTSSAKLSLLGGAIAVTVSLLYANMFVVGDNYTVEAAQRQFARQNAEAMATGGASQVVSLPAVVAAVASAATESAVPPSITPPLAVAANDKSPAYDDGCLIHPQATTSPACTFGSTDPNAQVVVLFGDSHAAQWMPALLDIESRVPFKLVVLTKDSCPASTVSVYSTVLKRDYTECDQWRQWAINKIAALKPAYVVVSEHIQALAHSAPKQNWSDGVAKTLSELRGITPGVSMLSDVPAHAQHTPDCLAANPNDALKCADSVASSILVDHQKQDAAAAASVNVPYIDVTPWLCTDTLCPGMVANMVTTIDGSHLTATYARYLSHVLGGALGLESADAAGAASAGLASDGDIRAAVAAAMQPQPVPSTVAPPLAIANGDMSPAYTDGCLVDASKTTSPSCVFGDPTGAQTVVLFGDSHAAQWMPALQNAASRAKFKLVVLTKGNCPAPTMTVYSVELKRTFTECDQWRSWALDQIAQLKPALVVVSSTFHGVTTPDGQTQTSEVESDWETGLRTTLDKLQGDAKRVVFVSDVANHAQSVPECLSANTQNATNCADPLDNATLGSHETAQAATVQAAGATYLDVRPWFCTDASCPAMVNGIVTDFDDSHLTATYAKYLGHALGVALGLES